MALDYVVITSVDRDDLPDGGAAHFARTIAETRARLPQCRIEVLIPDFKGDERALRTVLDARPGRPQPQHRDRPAPVPHRATRGPLRARAAAARPLAHHRARDPDQVGPDGRPGRGDATKSSRPSATSARPAARSSRSASTCGRRSPTCRCRATTRPSEFAELKQIGLDLGFGHVESGPLVRSSYHAHEQTQALRQPTPSADGSG